MTKMPTLLAVLAASTVIQACSESSGNAADESENMQVEDIAASENTEEEAAPDTEGEAGEATQESTSTDWTQINDSAIRAEIDQRLAAFQEEYFDRFNLLVVDRLDGADRWQAAGEAAFELGGPTIVVATEQRDVQIVGDEALAYLEEDRIRLQNGLAEHFNRGEFVTGIETFLRDVVPVWYGD